jgi:hypothetical protein
MQRTQRAGEQGRGTLTAVGCEDCLAWTVQYVHMACHVVLLGVTVYAVQWHCPAGDLELAMVWGQFPYFVSGGACNGCRVCAGRMVLWCCCYLVGSYSSRGMIEVSISSWSVVGSTRRCECMNYRLANNSSQFTPFWGKGIVVSNQAAAGRAAFGKQASQQC